MHCPHCESANPEGAKFCNECGGKLEQSCPECGSINPPGAKFCNECGQKLQARTKTQAPPVDRERPRSYTPKHLAEKILTSRSSIEGERKLVTVMFADVAGFTSLSEQLEPEEVHAIMDGCFHILMQEIHKQDGTINQFTGDGVMALFGAPVAHEDHAGRACRAALGIQQAMQAYGDRISRDYGLPFKLRIGLNAGPVIVGAIGDDLRMDYTAVGDTTNLAARMEHLARPGSVLVSESIFRRAKDFFELQSLGPTEIKGKAEPQEVFELLRTGEAATRIDAALARGLTRFVGRDKAMATLMELYDKVQNNQGQVVGIAGEAGVGKSRLVYEFQKQLSGVTCLEGRCIHYGGSMPYLPILDVLRSLFSIEDGEREVRVRKRVTETVLGLDANLSEALSPLQDLLSLKVEDEAYQSLEPKQRKERVFEALRNLLISLSQQHPLVLVIEDLHWIDTTTQEFLDYFIGWMATAKVLLILVYRLEYTHQWGSRSYFNRIGLDQLSPASSTELVRAILHGGLAAPELQETIFKRAAGNPLFMEELTQTLLENGSICKQEDQYVLTQKGSELQVPDTVQGIIAARIDRLEENLKRIMQVASVIGRDFAFRILQSITGRQEELKAQHMNLQGLEFIYEKNLFPELEYIFKHALTQEVAYNSLLATRRKEIHLRIGQAIESIYADRLEEFYEVLAYHYSKGEDIEKASEYLKLSGKKANRNYARQEAYDFYTQGVELLQKLPESEERNRKILELVVLLLKPLTNLGFPEGSLTLLETGECFSHELGESLYLRIIQQITAMFYSFRGNQKKSVEYTENAFYTAFKSQDEKGMADILALSLAANYLSAGEYQKFLEKASKAIKIIMKKEDKYLYHNVDSNYNPYPMLLNQYGLSLGLTGQFIESEKFHKKGIRIALQTNDFENLGVNEYHYGTNLHLQGKYVLAKQHTEISIQHLLKTNNLLFLAPAYRLMGITTFFLGNTQSSIQYLEKGLQLLQKLKVDYLVSLFHYSYGLIHMEIGDCDKGSLKLKESLKLARKNGERWVEGVSFIGLGRCSGMMGADHIDKAEESFSKGLKILDVLRLKPYYAQGLLYFGEMYLNAGIYDQALEHLNQAEEMFETMVMEFWQGRAFLLLADYSKQQGDVQKARELLGRALEIFQAGETLGWIKACEQKLVEIS